MDSSFQYFPTSLGIKRPHSFTEAEEDTNNELPNEFEEGREREEGPQRKRYLSAALAEQMEALKLRRNNSSGNLASKETGDRGGGFGENDGFGGKRRRRDGQIDGSGIRDGMGKEVGQALEEVENNMVLDEVAVGNGSEVNRMSLDNVEIDSTDKEDIVTLDLTSKDENAPKDRALIPRPIPSRTVSVYRNPLEHILGKQRFYRQFANNHAFTEKPRFGKLAKAFERNVYNTSMHNINRQWSDHGEKPRSQLSLIATGKRPHSIYMNPYERDPRSFSASSREEGELPARKRRHFDMEIE